jgi:ectoine hydroxylase-related dioxygenase (phytanoyl-CoA dioxygenase family)
VKEPGDGALTTWHQDGTYAGMAPPEGLTAWVALTASSAAAGALRFLPRSHAAGQQPHARGRGAQIEEQQEPERAASGEDGHGQPAGTDVHNPSVEVLGLH